MVDEQILVVKRDILFSASHAPDGLVCADLGSALACIAQHKEFLPRALMENDPTYKQVIPYLVFIHQNMFFMMQRTDVASEVRLRNKFSLGIGGHIRREDMKNDSIFAWAEREFHEEVDYAGNLKIEPLGLLNDDSNEVGRVHVGLVLLLHGDSADIKVKSELKSGRLVSFQECLEHEAAMENWSKIIIEHFRALPAFSGNKFVEKNL